MRLFTSKRGLTQVDKLSKENRSTRKHAERLSEEVAVLHAASLKVSRDTVLTVHRPTADNEYSLTLQRELREVCDKRVLLLTMGEQVISLKQGNRSGVL